MLEYDYRQNIILKILKKDGRYSIIKDDISLDCLRRSEADDQGDNGRFYL